jgi:hypothetical protein
LAITLLLLSGFIFNAPRANAVSLDYSGSGFTEPVADDGSVSGSIVSTLTGDTFKDDDNDNILDISTEVTVGNIPTGLTPSVKLSSTTASDGTVWVSQSTNSNNWQSITYGEVDGEGIFVAVSNSGTGDRVMTSPDGITWTTRVNATDDSWVDVTYGNGLFVAVSNSSNSNVMTSPDGITWTLRTGAGNNWRAVTYGGGLFVAVKNTSDNQIMTSSDGFSWSIVDPGAYGNPLLDVVYGEGLFVATGSDGTGDLVLTSPDGVTWTPRVSAEDNQWHGVAYGGGQFVAVAPSGTNRVMTSPNGINWTARSVASYAYYGITYGNGTFVAVSIASGKIITSSDGITWTAYDAANSNWWNGVTYGNSKFVAVSFTGTDNRAMTSIGDLDIATLSLTGNAASHTTDNNVSDITYVFDDSAFTTTAASSVTNSGSGGAYSTNLGVTFIGGSSSSSDSSSTSSTPSAPEPTAPFCSNLTPISIPSLFQIDRDSTQATIYFNPILGSDGYAIYYGEDNTANAHSVIIDRPTNHLGVVGHTVDHLVPGTKYWYRVAATSGCAIGPTGNTMTDNPIVYSENRSSEIDISEVLGVTIEELDEEVSVEKIKGKTTELEDDLFRETEEIKNEDQKFDDKKKNEEKDYFGFIKKYLNKLKKSIGR